MTVDFSEKWTDADNPQAAALLSLAGGRPYVFVTAAGDGGPGIDVAVEVGGGIINRTQLRNLLKATLDAIPEPEAADREIPS